MFIDKGIAINHSLPNITSTPKAKGSQTHDYMFHTQSKIRSVDKSMKVTPNNHSNVSFLRNEKSEIRQDQYFASPLLNQTQMNEVERQSKKRHNEMYSRMFSENPFLFNDDLAETNLLSRQPKVSNVAVKLFNLEDKSKVSQLLRETSSFCDQLSLHTKRIKPANVITQRQDVIKLAQWVDHMINQITNDINKNESDGLAEVEKVFTLCLKELVREISLDCLEKSILLEKIWTAYIQFTQQMFEQLEKNKVQMEQDYLQQLKRVHQTYQTSVDLMQSRIAGQLTQYNALLIKNQKNKAKYQNLKDAHVKLVNDYENLNNEHIDLKLEKQIINAEKERLQNYISINDQELQRRQEILFKKADVRNVSAKKFSLRGTLLPEDENSKACDTQDLLYEMTLHENLGVQTEMIELNSQTAQTDVIAKRNYSQQTEDVAYLNAQQEIPGGLSQEETVKRLLERKITLEDQIRIDNQNTNELRKTIQQLKRDNEAKSLKLANQEQTIIQQQIEIDRLLQELNNLRRDSKKQSVPIVGVINEDQKEGQLQLIPQRKESIVDSQLQPSELDVDIPQVTIERRQTEHQPISKTKPQPQQQKSQSKQDIKKRPTVIPKSQAQIPQQMQDDANLPQQPEQQRKSIQRNISNKTQVIQQRKSEQQQQPQQQPQQQKSAQQNPKEESMHSKISNPSLKKNNLNQSRRSSQSINNSQLQNVQDRQSMPKGQFYHDVALAFVLNLSSNFWANPDLVEASMPVSNVLKIIHTIYSDRLQYKAAIYSLTYEFYMNTFGLKNIAEQKMTQFCSSVFYYRTIPRIQLFGRFLQLFDRLNDDDAEFYMLSLSQLDEQSNPQNLTQCQGTSESVVISYLKAQEQMKLLKDQASDLETTLRKQIKTTNGKNILDLDYYFQEALEQFQLMRTVHKDNYNELFIAVDVNDNGQIELEEFMIILQLIEGDVDLLAYRKFFNEAINGKQSLTFQQFGMFCMHHSLFTKHKQQKFSKESDLDEQRKELKVQWDDLRRQVTSRLRQCCCFTEYYQDLVRKLDNAIKSNQTYSWLLWRILEEQSKRLQLDNIVHKSIGWLQIITDKYQELDLY